MNLVEVCVEDTVELLVLVDVEPVGAEVGPARVARAQQPPPAIMCVEVEVRGPGGRVLVRLYHPDDGIHAAEDRDEVFAQSEDHVRTQEKDSIGERLGIRRWEGCQQRFCFLQLQIN
jgi:hypothetical protein